MPNVISLIFVSSNFTPAAGPHKQEPPMTAQLQGQRATIVAAVRQRQCRRSPAARRSRAAMAAAAQGDPEFDVVICGGGIQAASIAYHLTLRGAPRVRAPRRHYYELDCQKHSQLKIVAISHNITQYAT